MSNIACNRKLNQPNQNRISKYRRKPDIFYFAIYGHYKFAKLRSFISPQSDC